MPPAATVTGGSVCAGRTVLTGFSVRTGPDPPFNVVAVFGAGTVGNDAFTRPLPVPVVVEATVVAVAAFVVLVLAFAVVAVDALAVVADEPAFVVAVFNFTVDAVADVADFFPHAINDNPHTTTSAHALAPEILLIPLLLSTGRGPPPLHRA